MKFLLDENVPSELRKVLKKSKYDVEHINYSKKGYTDKQVWEYAYQTKRVLVSLDSDFCKYRKKEHYGLIKISAKVPNIADTFLCLLKYIQDKKIDVKDTYFQIDINKAFYEVKKYSKRKNKFKNFQNIPIKLNTI